MDKKTEETKKLNAKSRQNKSMESESSYTNMNYSDLQQVRQENMNSASSASNSVSPFSNEGTTGYPKPDDTKVANQKSRQNRGK